MDEMRNVSTSSVAQALAADYFSIYYVNTETDRFIEYSASSEYQDLGIETSGEDFFNLSRKNVLRVIYPEDQEMFLEAFTKEKLLATLDLRPTFTLTYRLMFGDTPTYVHMKATRMKDRSDKHIVIGVSNIDDQMKAKEAYNRAREQTLTYSRIAQALADDYFSIYCVDPDTDTFVEYSATQAYDRLGIEKGGENFFETSRRNLLSVVYSEDQEKLLAVFTKEKLMAEMQRNGMFTINYRLMLEGQPTWVSMKATLLEDSEGKHIIIGVNNIDAQMRREEAFSRDLTAAQDKANRDALTGVKSKHAFVELEEKLARQIAAGEQADFAIVVCDVNGLKAVNDTQGHAAGDLLIRQASATICDIFKHSPVFRTGGDEFVVVVQGPDYKDHEALMGALQAHNAANRMTGGVIIASGLARFAPGDSFSVVFERADALMYENKRKLKHEA